MTMWLTPSDVAKILKISYEKALDFIKHSGIKHVKIGRQYRVTEASLASFLSRNSNIDLRA